MHKNKIEKLPIIDDRWNVLKGLITIKDINKVVEYPNAIKDEEEDYLLVLLLVLVKWIEQLH